MASETVTYHLEMTSPDQLRPAAETGPEIQIRQVELPCPELNRFFYKTVGAQWQWRDRLLWTDQQWLDYLEPSQLQTWVGYVSGTPIGYFELETQPGGNVEIAYFGLLPRFIGRGFGGRLLTAAIRYAWQTGASRVWVHTCTLDHPSALDNYRARGFTLFKEVVGP